MGAATFSKMLAFPPDPRNRGRKPGGSPRLRRESAGDRRRPGAQGPPVAAEPSNAMKHGLLPGGALLPRSVANIRTVRAAPISTTATPAITTPVCVAPGLFMLHRAAFQQRDPDALRDLHADNQAQIRAILQDIVLAITRTGVRLQTLGGTPIKGRSALGGTLQRGWRSGAAHEDRAHPLIKAIFEIMSRDPRRSADGRRRKRGVAGFP